MSRLENSAAEAPVPLYLDPTRPHKDSGKIFQSSVEDEWFKCSPNRGTLAEYHNQYIELLRMGTSNYHCFLTTRVQSHPYAKTSHFPPISYLTLSKPSPLQHLVPPLLQLSNSLY
jgi:hypothetical protein